MLLSITMIHNNLFVPVHTTDDD